MRKIDDLAGLLEDLGDYLIQVPVSDPFKEQRSMLLRRIDIALGDGSTS